MGVELSSRPAGAGARGCSPCAAAIRAAPPARGGRDRHSDAAEHTWVSSMDSPFPRCQCPSLATSPEPWPMLPGPHCRPQCTGETSRTHFQCHQVTEELHCKGVWGVKQPMETPSHCWSGCALQAPLAVPGFAAGQPNTRQVAPWPQQPLGSGPGAAPPRLLKAAAAASSLLQPGLC